jgi:hypothetical protein
MRRDRRRRHRTVDFCVLANRRRVQILARAMCLVKGEPDANADKR